MLLTLLTITQPFISNLSRKFGQKLFRNKTASSTCLDTLKVNEMANEANTHTNKATFYEVELNKTLWNIPEQYTDLKHIGAGAFGQVYSAYDSVRNQTVAIKKLKRPFQSFEHAKRTYREIKLLSFLNHENVIDLLNVFTPSNTYEDFQDVYFVSSYIGADLNTHIKAQHLTFDQIQLIAYQILRALKYVHSAGIIHRDLKPSNIVVSPDAEVKVIDFGLARLGDEQMTGYVTTRYYRAPEITLNWMRYDETVDIWSVGCIMAEMMTGRTLFRADHILEQLKKTIAVLGTPGNNFLQKLTSIYGRQYIESQPKVEKKDFSEVFPGADEQFLDLLEQMLCFDPDDRLTAEQAISHPFFGVYRDPDEEPTSESFIDPKDSNSIEIEVWRELVYELVTEFEPPEVDPLDV